MGETWFHGRSTKSQPSMPKDGFVHDLGDGLYLSDRTDVARQYGEDRAGQIGGKAQVLEVKIKPGELGRVLDLRNNQKWKAYLDTPIVPGNQQSTPRNYISSRSGMGANQNYSEFFETFLKQNKIDISQYDAVIAPELKNGGNQLCILHKRGGFSKIAQRIRARWRLLGFRPTGGGVVIGRQGASGSRSPARGGIRGRIIPRVSIRGIGKGVGMGALGIGFGLLVAHLRAKLDQRIIERQIREMSSKIAEESRKHFALLEALEIDREGKTPWANVVLTINYTISREPGMPSIQVADLPVVLFKSLTVSDRKREGTGPRTTERHFGWSREITPYRFAVRMELPRDLKTIYAEYKALLDWYDERLANPPPYMTNQDIISLRLDRAKVWVEAYQALFGSGS